MCRHYPICHYTLYIEGDVTDEIAARLDTSLCRNPHYAWCRKTGQIQPLRLFRIKTAGYKTFVAREQSSGKQLGEIKPRSISKENGWSHHFQGEYVTCAGS